MYAISTNRHFAWLITVFCFVVVFDLSAQSSLERRIIRKAIVDSAFAQVGNYEKTNNNDGVIDKYRKAFKQLGSKAGDAYCSWGILYCMKLNGIKPYTNGRAKSWEIPESSIIRKFGKIVKNEPIRQGDQCLSYDRKTGSYHIELFVSKIQGTDFCFTVGFNTWSKFEHGKRRQGVWIHRRNLKNLIICNQLQFIFKNEKTKIHRIATILSELQRVRLQKN